MIALANVADILGLPGKLAPRSPIGLVARIEDGLPLDTLERVARLVAPEAEEMLAGFEAMFAREFSQA